MKSVIKAVIAVVVLAGAASAGLMDDIKGQTSALAVSGVDSRASLTADEQAKLQTYRVHNTKSQADNKAEVEAILAALKSKNMKVSGVRQFTQTYNNSHAKSYCVEISYISPDGSSIGSYYYYAKSEVDTIRRLGITVFYDSPWAECQGGHIFYFANDAKGEVIKETKTTSLTHLGSKAWLDANVLAYKAKGYVIIRAEIMSLIFDGVLNSHYKAEIAYMPLNR